MQVECPKCHTLLAVGAPGPGLTCPECRTPLDVEYDDEGVMIVSVGQGEDPVIADHERWRGVAVIAMVTGAVVLVYIGASTFADFQNYGMAFFRKTSNLLFMGLAAGVSLLSAVGGAVLLVLVNREIRRYNEVVAQRRAGHGGRGNEERAA
ncbi:MAG: hypothetical protein ACLFOY_08590 [Desulfatibacillaceae bacterium]